VDFIQRVTEDPTSPSLAHPPPADWESAADTPAPRRLPAGRRWHLCRAGDPLRPALEAFIRAGFRRRHEASICSFMPRLLGLYEDGQLVGAAGYRRAAEEPLFLEQYLTEPVETLVARRGSAGHVDRADIAEIGNFAASRCATAVTLVQCMAGLVQRNGHRWVVFTATRTVRGIMERMGIALVEIGRADASRVDGNADHWGRYYDTDPRIMLGHVPSYRPARPRST
jgi:Thermostable hemolysin